MALFNFGKKKEDEKQASSCCCGSETVKGTANICCCGANDEKATSTCCGETVDGVCCIKVLGAGCKSCHDQYEYAKEAVKSMGLNVEVKYITDMPTVINYGVMSMPAIVVNERVVSVGKVLKAKDVEKLINNIR